MYNFEGITPLRLRKSSTAFEGITHEGITLSRLRESSTAPLLLRKSSTAYEGYNSWNCGRYPFILLVPCNAGSSFV